MELNNVKSASRESLTGIEGSFFAPPEETDQAVKNVRHCPVACNYCRIQRTQIHPTVGCVGMNLIFIHTLRTHYKSSDALDRSECGALCPDPYRAENHVIDPL